MLRNKKVIRCFKAKLLKIKIDDFLTFFIFPTILNFFSGSSDELEIFWGSLQLAKCSQSSFTLLKRSFLITSGGSFGFEVAILIDFIGWSLIITLVVLGPLVSLLVVSPSNTVERLGKLWSHFSPGAMISCRSGPMRHYSLRWKIWPFLHWSP